MSDEKDTALPKHQWAYAGRRLSDDKVFYCWVQFTEQGELFHSFGTNIASAPIGGLYEVVYAKPDGSSVYTSGEKAPKYLGLIDDDERRREWQAVDMATVSRLAALRIERNDRNSSLIRDALFPLRRAMNSQAYLCR